VAPLDIVRPRPGIGPDAMRGGGLPPYPDPFIRRPEVRDLLPISMGPRRGDVVAALVGGRVQHDHIHTEDSGWSEP
jgi:hypothetical protein